MSLHVYTVNNALENYGVTNTEDAFDYYSILCLFVFLPLARAGYPVCSTQINDERGDMFVDINGKVVPLGPEFWLITLYPFCLNTTVDFILY